MKTETNTYRLLNRTSEAVGTMSRKVLAPFGLNCNEYAILEILYEENGQSIYQIGEEVMVASSTMTYLVDKLEKNNYIRREASPEDRRSFIVRLTEDGKELVEEILPEHEAKMTEIFSCFTEEETENIMHLLGKVQKNLQKA
jgi:MarR family 2-MHQ and catechol resistance regulon transcriptional repressor